MTKTTNNEKNLSVGPNPLDPRRKIEHIIKCFGIITGDRPLETSVDECFFMSIFHSLSEAQAFMEKNKEHLEKFEKVRICECSLTVDLSDKETNA